MISNITVRYIVSPISSLLSMSISTLRSLPICRIDLTIPPLNAYERHVQTLVGQRDCRTFIGEMHS